MELLIRVCTFACNSWSEKLVSKILGLLLYCLYGLFMTEIALLIDYMVCKIMICSSMVIVLSENI